MNSNFFESNNPERLGQWIALSHRLASISNIIDPHITTRVQRLGELDCFIMEMESKIDTKDIFNTTNILYLSHLWILDFNEILRILDSKDVFFNQFYKKIKGIRMPLAKHEKEGKNKYGFIAYPIIQTKSCRVGWSTTESEIFFRTDFSIDFLEKSRVRYLA